MRSHSGSTVSYTHLDVYKRQIVSIMNQFTPSADLADAFPELGFRVSEDEYDELIDYVLDLGIANSFMQEGDTADESFIPSFDYEGV